MLWLINAYWLCKPEKDSRTCRTAGNGSCWARPWCCPCPGRRWWWLWRTLLRGWRWSRWGSQRGRTCYLNKAEWREQSVWNTQFQCGSSHACATRRYHGSVFIFSWCQRQILFRLLHQWRAKNFRKVLENKELLWFTAKIIEFISNETYCASMFINLVNPQTANELDYRLGSLCCLSRRLCSVQAAAYFRCWNKTDLRPILLKTVISIHQINAYIMHIKKTYIFFFRCSFFPLHQLHFCVTLFVTSV